MQTRYTETTVMRIDSHGDATRLQPATLSLPPPTAGEVQVRHSAIGVNFVDVYHRTGRYPLPGLPAVLGVEACGVIEAIGSAVDGLLSGQRVAYVGVPAGSYASVRNVPAEWLIPLPDDLADDTVAALLLRGITAHMLLTHVRPLAPGDTLLVQAAAGGLGLVLVQWAKALGAGVIGTVGSKDKAALAKAAGLDEAILYRECDFVAETRRLTHGQGADMVVDGIGGDTLRRSLAAARPFGLVASVGQVSGEAGQIDLATLDGAASVALSRPSVMRFIREPAWYRAGALATIERLRAGLRPHIDSVLPLTEAAQAHRRLESGRSAGSIVLRP